MIKGATKNSPSISVIESILNSRIDQVIAITLPSDQHRHDILNSIKTTNSCSQRLSAFCDYLIDYIGTLTIKIQESANNSQEINLDENIKNKQNQNNKKVKQLKISNEIKNDLDDFSDIEDNEFDYNLESLKKDCQYGIDNQNEDYLLSLKLLQAEEGHLSTSVNELIHQNHHLQRLHNQDRAILLKQHFIINESCFSNDSDSYSSKPKRHYHRKIRNDSNNSDDDILRECQKLKRDFRHISHDINDLKDQVRQNYHTSSSRHKYH